MSTLGQIPIKDFMTKDPFLLRSDDTLADAYQKIKEHQIRHLPVVDPKDRLVGVFTERDLHHAYAPRETDSGWYYDRGQLALLCVPHFMTSHPVTLTPEHTLKDAVDIFVRNKFGCIPIVEADKKLAGIVSYVDVLKKIKDLL